MTSPPAKKSPSVVDENSHDSGVGIDSKVDVDALETECTRLRISLSQDSVSAFKEPVGRAPRTSSSSDEAQSPFRYSPAPSDAPQNFHGAFRNETSLIEKVKATAKDAETQEINNDSDDSLLYGFIDSDDGIDLTSPKVSASRVSVCGHNHGYYCGRAAFVFTFLFCFFQRGKLSESSFNTLMTGRIIHRAEDDTPKHIGAIRSKMPGRQLEKQPRRACRPLFRSPSAPSGLRRAATMDGSFTTSPYASPEIAERCPGSAQKRRTPPTSQEANCKRARPDDDDTASPVIVPFLRSKSSEAEIKNAVHKMSVCPDLIGDSFCTHVLPTTLDGRNGIRSISAETLADVLKGDFKDVIERCIIVDARYPYEFQQGHIRGALNLYTPDHIDVELLEGIDKKVAQRESTKRTVLVFHCEFSSDRGPRL